MTSTSPEAAKAASTGAASPEELLKAAVGGGKETVKVEARPAPAVAEVTAAAFRLSPQLLGLAGGALALGCLIGAGVTAGTTGRGERQAGALTELNAGLEANRVEAARLNGEIERLAKNLAGLRETAEGTRSEAKARGTALTERLGKVEQALSAKVAGLGERLEQGDREQATRLAALATLVEKRSAPATAPAPVTAPQAAAPAAKAEPTQTGSIAEAKPQKPAVVEGWAVRDVYEGTAMLEDRRRRLLEVAPGDSVPGVGRVEAVERRGREWVVVTRGGLITPQSW
ncbi:hypothetical protein [Methylobacterium sp. A54F]